MLWVDIDGCRDVGGDVSGLASACFVWRRKPSTWRSLSWFLFREDLFIRRNWKAIACDFMDPCFEVRLACSISNFQLPAAPTEPMTFPFFCCPRSGLHFVSSAHDILLVFRQPRYLKREDYHHTGSKDLSFWCNDSASLCPRSAKHTTKIITCHLQLEQ